MSFGNEADQVLKYAKARAKLCELKVAREQWPKFNRNPDDLSYTSILTISEFCDTYIRYGGVASKADSLKKVAAYYDAASADTVNVELTDGELILATAAYFLQGNYGSCLVSIGLVHEQNYYGERCGRFVALIRYLLGLERSPQLPEDVHVYNYFQLIDSHRPSLEELVSRLVNWDGPEERFFGKLLCVATDLAFGVAARKLLPKYSTLGLDVWKSYLQSDQSPRILWRAQEEIARSDALAGRSVFIQLPTGSGKTKSIELILRARILAKMVRNAVVIAPFLSLCAEIETSLRDALVDIAVVYRSTYSLEVDSWLREESGLPKVMVFTPEKYSFINRHVDSAFDTVDLYIMDEAHVIADSSRGPRYELTVSEILAVRPEAQVVMISAVLPNPCDFAIWAMRDSTAIVADEEIPSSEKAVGFSLGRGMRISYRERYDVRRQSYFVPLTPRVQVLKRRSREKERCFPDLNAKKPTDAARDKAIYLADILSSSGGVAIYVPKPISVGAFYGRLTELFNRGCKLEGFYRRANPNELEKFVKLFSLHYGTSNNFAAGIQYGVLPHYSRLQGCIRQAVERAIQHQDARCIMCTTTLAQGVNLPIRSLIVTGIHTGIDIMASRDFQNLIGRAARPGKYSEGNILITDVSNISSNKQREYYALLDSKNRENCMSAILGLFDNVQSNGNFVSGLEIFETILSNDGDCHLQDVLIRFLLERGVSQKDAVAAARNRLTLLSAIETYIAQMLTSSAIGEIDLETLCRNTLAYSQLASNQPYRQRLLNLFNVIAQRVHDPMRVSRISLYSKTQMGIRQTDALLQWCASEDSDPFANDTFSFGGLKSLCEGFLSITQCNDNWLKGAQIAYLAQLWMQAAGIADMIEAMGREFDFDSRHRPNVTRIEKQLKDTIGFDLSNYISCIADIVELDESGLLSKFDSDELHLLHRFLRYGVSSLFECLFCESVIDDRLIAHRLQEELNLGFVVDGTFLKFALARNSDEVDLILEDYPRYCRERFHEYLGVS